MDNEIHKGKTISGRAKRAEKEQQFSVDFFLHVLHGWDKYSLLKASDRQDRTDKIDLIIQAEGLLFEEWLQHKYRTNGYLDPFVEWLLFLPQERLVPPYTHELGRDVCGKSSFTIFRNDYGFIFPRTESLKYACWDAINLWRVSVNDVGRQVVKFGKLAASNGQQYVDLLATDEQVYDWLAQAKNSNKDVITVWRSPKGEVDIKFRIDDSGERDGRYGKLIVYFTEDWLQKHGRSTVEYGRLKYEDEESIHQPSTWVKRDSSLTLVSLLK